MLLLVEERGTTGYEDDDGTEITYRWLFDGCGCDCDCGLCPEISK
jgi:hypothetical protein